MLQRLNSPFDEELLVGDGLWSRAELERMNDSFTVAVERAFELKLESRAAAAATYSGNAMNGKQYIEAVIEAAWRWFRDAKFEATAVEVVARCPGVSPELVRVGFKRRLASWIGEVR